MRLDNARCHTRCLDMKIKGGHQVGERENNDGKAFVWVGEKESGSYISSDDEAAVLCPQIWQGCGVDFFVELKGGQERHEELILVSACADLNKITFPRSKKLRNKDVSVKDEPGCGFV